MMFDHFGNAMTDIKRSHLAGLEKDAPAITCNRVRFHLVGHYEEGAGDSAIAIINSDHYLELAVFNKSAKQRFNLGIGDSVILT